MDRLDEYLYGSLKDEHRPKKTLNEKVLCVCAGELGLQNTGVKARNKTGKQTGNRTERVFVMGRLKAAAVIMSLFLVVGISGYAVARNAGFFTLKTGDKEMDVEKAEPLEIDFESFKAMEETEYDNESQTYFHEFTSVDVAEKTMGIKLWSSDEITAMGPIMIALSTYGTGHISGGWLKYGDMEFALNGQFTFDNNTDGMGYGTKRQYYRTYKYGDEKTAYFVKDAGYDGDEEHSAKQVVYFTANNIQYQLFVERTDDGTKMAEEIIDIIAQR